jgi:hypothetical protein
VLAGSNYTPVGVGVAPLETLDQGVDI